jgi:hypothetical protein
MLFADFSLPGRPFVALARAERALRERAEGFGDGAGCSERRDGLIGVALSASSAC